MTIDHELQRSGHRSIGTELARCFAEDGVVCIRGLIDRSWLEVLADAMEEAIRHPGPGRNPRTGKHYVVENSLWRHREAFRRFATESPVAEAAAAVMGSREVRLYNDAMFVKEPGGDEPTQWHHDLPYFKIAGAKNCSVWIGLDAVTKATGALSFVRGSHRWGKLFRPVSFGQGGGGTLARDGFDGPVPDIDADPERYPTIGWDLEPGDVTFHHLLTIHGALPNSSATVRRRAHTIRFAGEGTTWLNRPYSPAEFETDLRDGDLLEGPLFPVLWPRRPAHAAA